MTSDTKVIFILTLSFADLVKLENYRTLMKLMGFKQSAFKLSFRSLTAKCLYSNSQYLFEPYCHRYFLLSSHSILAFASNSLFPSLPASKKLLVKIKSAAISVMAIFWYCFVLKVNLPPTSFFSSTKNAVTAKSFKNLFGIETPS